MGYERGIWSKWHAAFPTELICWVAALVFLYVSGGHNPHFTLCPLENAGFDWCPGCGLGRSIGLFMHGEVVASFHMHWLGIPAFFIIVHRIYTLLINEYNNRLIDQNHEQPQYIDDH
ncbi:DUF2752 domain-containing protein [Parapedobacter koreensis]|uniref:DUF2752 domain-containing protein n=1 Tax=Parapedobacter koreensis TaxID=332977 RepID=A0A1H7RJJ5_9SPHI|nr:DUF2752 domain-containing protein [Parapedobacter koreensis]SEL60279.1 Protein of unknown function [Parapedobacter koreensis]